MYFNSFQQADILQQCEETEHPDLQGPYHILDDFPDQLAVFQSERKRNAHTAKLCQDSPGPGQFRRGPNISPAIVLACISFGNAGAKLFDIHAPFCPLVKKTVDFFSFTEFNEKLYRTADKMFVFRAHGKLRPVLCCSGAAVPCAPARWRSRCTGLATAPVA